MKSVQGLALTFLAFAGGCAREVPLRLGVDPALEELGAGAWIVAGLESAGFGRVETVPLPGGGYVEGTDLVLGLGDGLMAAAESGHIEALETVAHEEMVWIGPDKDLLGKYAHAKGADLLRNIARTHHRLLMGARGSPERRRLDRFFALSGDRDRPGSWFETKLAGRALVDAAIEKRAFALVRRSSLLEAAHAGTRPARVWGERDPELVLELRVGRPAGRARGAEAYRWLVSTKGQEHVAATAADRIGHAVLAPGAPATDQPAKLDSMKDWLRRRLETPESEEAR